MEETKNYKCSHSHLCKFGETIFTCDHKKLHKHYTTCDCSEYCNIVSDFVICINIRKEKILKINECGRK